MPDPDEEAIVERIFALVESGSTYRDVARALNADGLTGRRGQPFSQQTVSAIVHNPRLCR